MSYGITLRAPYSRVDMRAHNARAQQQRRVDGHDVFDVI